MRATFYTLLIALTVACTQGSDKLLEEIRSMQMSEDVGSPEHGARLAELHAQYGLKHSDSLGNAYLYAAAVYHYYQDNHAGSDSLFTTLLGRELDPERKRNAYFLLAMIKAGTGDHTSMESNLSSAIEAGSLTNAQWMDLLKAYGQVTTGREASTLDLYRMASAHVNLGNYDQGLHLMDSAIRTDPMGEMRPRLIHESAFLCWDVLRDAPRARSYYQLFLQDYPDHPLAEEVRSILDKGILDMSDEEIIKMLKAQNPEQ